jgi:hypothetical protein
MKDGMVCVFCIRKGSILPTFFFWLNSYYTFAQNALGIESEVAWATPGYFTISNSPSFCDRADIDCDSQKIMQAHLYMDPANNIDTITSRLRRRYRS